MSNTDNKRFCDGKVTIVANNPGDYEVKQVNSHVCEKAKVNSLFAAGVAAMCASLSHTMITHSKGSNFSWLGCVIGAGFVGYNTFMRLICPNPEYVVTKINE